MYTIGPIDRTFLAMRRPPVAGFFLDFHGPAPDPDGLRERVVSRAGALPALTHLLPERRARHWSPRAAPVDPDVHVHHRAVSSEQELADLCEALLARELPGRGDPPWDCWLLTGPPGSARFRICFRTHHALQDGVGAAHSVLGLLADTPARGPRLYPPAPSGLRAVLSAARETAAPALRPGPPWHAVRRFPAGPGEAAAARWAHGEVPFARLRSLADAHRTSVNDAALAALSLALRSWSAELSLPDAPVPARTLVAMSTRGPRQRLRPGNHIAYHRLHLPVTAPTFAASVAEVRRQTDAVRRTLRRDALRTVQSLPGPLAPPVLAVRAAVNIRLYPLAVSSVSFPEAFPCFGGRLAGASLFLHIADTEQRPVYVSFTRTPDTVRCTVVTDAARPHTTALPRYWVRAVG
ncbi:wax ester/triacylglycerol synthase domain-containing protein [Streptomyces sp. CRN 30]|uniref:wax ester/triacylglycerol synthase domain-containing protein n=1 Tax=Streptomyces sp. CRN 30 TaxID=3075613 RepID=UPI002A833E5F|nr:wax ester/triacylglycerol synthase domain-containing protein [Streptomyces sp. CRN 30]